MKPRALFGKKEKRPPVSASIPVRQKLSFSKGVCNTIRNMKRAIKKGEPERMKKNTPHVALVKEQFDDGEDEALNEMETFCYCIQEPRERTFAESVRETFLGDVTASSALKQFVIGGMVGWGTGYLALKLGETAAMAVGGTLFLCQVAQYNGLIKVNCIKVQHAYTKDDARVKNFEMKNRRSVFAKVRTFFEENFFLATGLATGYCLYFFS